MIFSIATTIIIAYAMVGLGIGSSVLFFLEEEKVEGEDELWVNIATVIGVAIFWPIFVLCVAFDWLSD